MLVTLQKSFFLQAKLSRSIIHDHQKTFLESGEIFFDKKSDKFKNFRHRPGRQFTIVLNDRELNGRKMKIREEAKVCFSIFLHRRTCFVYAMLKKQTFQINPIDRRGGKRA